MVLFGLPVTFAIAIEKHGDIFSAISFSLFLCFCSFLRYRVASIGEIRETIFIGLRSAKATVRNDTKIQMKHNRQGKQRHLLILDSHRARSG